jgi:hypothetical protein
MTAMKSDESARSGRVFTRNTEASARRRLRPEASHSDEEGISDEVVAVLEHLRTEHDRLQAEVVQLRTLIGQSIRVIEEQNARLREHGLEPVAPTQIQI